MMRVGGVWQNDAGPEKDEGMLGRVSHIDIDAGAEGELDVIVNEIKDGFVEIIDALQGLNFRKQGKNGVDAIGVTLFNVHDFLVKTGRLVDGFDVGGFLTRGKGFKVGH